MLRLWLEKNWYVFYRRKKGTHKAFDQLRGFCVCVESLFNFCIAETGILLVMMKMIKLSCLGSSRYVLFFFIWNCVRVILFLRSLANKIKLLFSVEYFSQALHKVIILVNALCNEKLICSKKSFFHLFSKIYVTLYPCSDNTRAAWNGFCIQDRK